MSDHITIAICPRCQNSFSRMPNSGDYVHECIGTPALSQEDVLVIGPWIDYTGSDTNVQNALMQGVENKLFGGRAWVEGDKLAPQRSARGFPTNRYRQRKHLETIPQEKFDKQGMVDTQPDEYFGSD